MRYSLSEQKLEKRCNDILTKLRKNFPILNNRKIILKVRRLRVGSMRVALKIGYYLIIVDSDKYSDAKDNQIIGGIAHELIHLEDYEKMGFYRKLGFVKYFIFLIHYNLSKRYTKKYEHSTDIRAIKKGYGKYVFLNRIYRLKEIFKNKNDKKIKDNYLMLGEIKKYIEKYKKLQK